MLTTLINWIRSFRPENPRRIREFRLKINDLSWDKQRALGSLSILFDAVDDLAEAEVRYYYRRRVTRSWISGVTRFWAWFLGTVGLLIPLLPETTEALLKALLPETIEPVVKDWRQYGYVALAAAASFLAANSLFGGTEGHIRFASTQLEIEKLITASRVGWLRYVAGKREPDDDLADGFAIILSYANTLHTATIAETGRWGETHLAELAKYKKAIDPKSDIPSQEK